MMITKQDNIRIAKSKLEQLADQVNELIALSEVLKQYFEDGANSASTQNDIQHPSNEELEQLCQHFSNQLYNSSQVANTIKRLAWESENIQEWLSVRIEGLMEANHDNN